MVRLLYVWLLFMGAAGTAFGQKPVLDEYNLDHWPKVNVECLSKDGHYIVYRMSMQHAPGESFFLRSLTDGYIKELESAGDFHFTADSRELFYRIQDTLARLDLASKQASFIAGVRSYKMPETGGMPMLAYHRNDGELVVINGLTRLEKHFDHVQDYGFSPSGKRLLIFQQDVVGDNPVVGLRWEDMVNDRLTKVWQGQTVPQYVIDSSERKLVLLSDGDKRGRHCSIWEFDSRKDSAARLLVSDTSGELEPGYCVANGDLRYSPDGERLFFDMYREADTIRPAPDAVKVDVWNYQDEYLQCDQLNNLNSERNRRYLSVVNVSSGKIIRLEQYGDGEWGEPLSEGDDDNYVLTCTRSNMAEAQFSAKERSDLWLVDTRTGERIGMTKRILPWNNGEFSAGGQYVVRYEGHSSNLYVYNILKRRWDTIDVRMLRLDQDEFYGYGGWLEGDKGILMYDKYDIWQIDPEGKVAPVNITNGYGRRHGIYLRMSVEAVDNARKLVQEKGSWIVCAFGEHTKANGFYRVGKEGGIDPQRLTMGPEMIYFPGYADGAEFSNLLLRARDTSTYVLMRESAEESPNVVVTHDFKDFTALTQIAPEKKVNWFTTELVRWSTFDGRPGQGILYKPENFDSTRRYPIIFYFYQQLSGRLNAYISPTWAIGAMNIPWFVSRGYLVFCPDIEYTMGNPGKGIYNYVVSAATMMQRKPWVDAKRMGIQGHSFGGYEVNYLITKTNLFAAASEGAGASDLVSHSGEAGLAGCSNQNFTENGQFRMKVALWQNVRGYIDNSPVFGADKVTTPLLMLQCQKDGATAWPQGVELFTALRRLGKPCYMLQYDDGGHVVEGKDAVDYTRRQTQFFDHYLKGWAEPKWMVEGIPARLKGIDSGLELPRTDVGIKK